MPTLPRADPYLQRVTRAARAACGRRLAQRLAPKVVAGFVDRDVERLLGLDPAREGALALVPLGRTAEPPAPAPDAPVLNLETEPLSSRETEYPAIRELHGASRLEHGEEVARWGRVVLPRPEPDSRSELFPRGRVRSERLVLSQTSRKATCSDTGPHAPTHCGTRRCSDRAADDGGVCLWREEPLAYFEGPRSPTAAHLSLKGVGSGPFSSLRLAAVAELAAHSAAWEGGVVHVHVVLLRMVDDAWSRAGSTFSPQPLVGGIRGTTLGPFTPAGATWMWAPNAGAMLETEISQQTLACPTLSVIDANPVPSGSAGGTPSVVAGGAPPPARGRSFRPVQARAGHLQARSPSVTCTPLRSRSPAQRRRARLGCSALLGYLRTTTIVSEKPRTSDTRSVVESRVGVYGTAPNRAPAESLKRPGFPAVDR